MESKLHKYLEELIAFNPASATEEERKEIVLKGKNLVESTIEPSPLTLQDIIERRKKNVDTGTISVPVHVRSNIDMHLKNVDRILEVKKLTQERYIEAAGAIAKTITSLISLAI